ncbi:hypothetical protein BH11BAC3_BH11BAC3_18340 [soil metagenome]
MNSINMATKESATPKEISPKGQIIQDLISTLTNVLVSLKESLGEKKFEKRIKKAAKILGEGIKPAPAKKVTGKNPIAKKSTKKATTEAGIAKKTPVRKGAKV